MFDIYIVQNEKFEVLNPNAEKRVFFVHQRNLSNYWEVDEVYQIKIINLINMI